MLLLYIYIYIYNKTRQQKQTNKHKQNSLRIKYSAIKYIGFMPVSSATEKIYYVQGHIMQGIAQSPQDVSTGLVLITPWSLKRLFLA